MEMDMNGDTNKEVGTVTMLMGNQPLIALTNINDPDLAFYSKSPLLGRPPIHKKMQ